MNVRVLGKKRIDQRL